MPYIENLFSGKLSNLQEALDRTTRRHSLLADNLANVNTPGYKRQDIDFNIVLNSKLNPKGVRQRDMQEKLAQQASDNTSLRLDGNNVDMEREVMAVTETELRYETLTGLTQSYFSELKNVIHEGK